MTEFPLSIRGQFHYFPSLLEEFCTKTVGCSAYFVSYLGIIGKGLSAVQRAHLWADNRVLKADIHYFEELITILYQIEFAVIVITIMGPRCTLR